MRWRAPLALAALVTFGYLALQVAGAWSRDRLGEQVARAARPGDIRIIGSTTCVYCGEARRWFEVHRVPFDECLIEQDAACAATYRKLWAPGTPVLLVRGRRIVGFDRQAIADALTPASG